MEAVAYCKYGPALVRKAERILQNRSDAEDIVQSLFHQLIEQKGATLDLPYLYQATTNRCLNFMRDRKRRTGLLQRQDVVLRGPVRTRCDERVIDLDLLLKLVEVLDGKCAEVLIYHFYDDMAQETIALRTGLSRKTIGRYLEKVRDKVRELSNQEGPKP